MNSKDKKSIGIDPAKQLELLNLQCQKLGPNLYRIYALYLQELRSILLNSVRTSVIGLIIERSSNSFENIAKDSFKSCPHIIDELVAKCSSFLTVEQVIALGRQLEEENKVMIEKTNKQIVNALNDPNQINKDHQKNHQY